MSLISQKLAADPNITAEKLYQLSETEDKFTLIKIAQNPNTPPDLLIELFQKHCLWEILDNPVLELILLEMPDFLDKLRQVRGYFFGREKLPDLFFELSPYFSIELRQNLANNLNTLKYYLEKLVGDRNEEVRCFVARNENIIKYYLEKLVSNESSLVRSNIALNPNTPRNILEKLAKLDKNKKIRSFARNNLRQISRILNKKTVQKY